MICYMKYRNNAPQDFLLVEHVFYYYKSPRPHNWRLCLHIPTYGHQRSLLIKQIIFPTHPYNKHIDFYHAVLPNIMPYLLYDKVLQKKSHPLAQL